MTSRPGQAEVSRPGLHGLLGRDDDHRLALLVTDDRAYDGLVGLSSDARAGMVLVFAAAARCVKLLSDDRRWRPAAATTAMVCRDISAVPRLELPRGLALSPVRRVAGDPPDGVALEDAVAAVVIADPAEDARTLTGFLRSLPEPVRLFAAVDAAGTVRATSGWQGSGAHTRVMFVDTDPAWRGRGVATAMTSAALVSARDQGAREASLDASAAGRSIYLHLGFEEAGSVIRFVAGG